ncbi:hypothetical protein EUX98_g2850 [Antrodiella citrinella]|uniref:Protein kinase domain-containing protein n=1 Tax=Antrodiella citrinella TaxID=2447956 RepID=A0A4S4MY07_9APHY|nr:hypothetical protein EUX98_g2850 [Antrodiella citrinella]
MVDIIRGQLDEQKIDEHLGRSLLDSLDGIVHSPGSDAGLAGSLRDVRREPNAISSGAFSDVYKGTWQGRAVAVKKLNRFNARPYNADAFQDAFSRELLIWQKLQHPNLLPILGVDDQTVAPRLGLISPWMKAGNVQEAMRDMEEPPVLQWIRQVAQGLEYLHEKKCVHGDIRGANVLVDDDLKVQLADFGLAAFTNPTRCDRTKARWTAPELLSGTIPRPNRESDVFSFASLCFELLTRNVPYGDIDHDADVIHMVLRGERPRSADTKMPEVLRTAMQICWREDPKERPKMPAVVSSLVELDGSTNRNSLQVLRRDGDVASE